MTTDRTMTRRGFLATTAALGAGALFPATLAAVEPTIRTASYNSLTEQEEIALGRKFATEYEKTVRLLANPGIDAYLTRMVRQLAAASQRPQWPFQVKVVNDDSVNASAIPGGFLYVHRGLLAFAEDDNEVAGAVAHEIGHVVGRHTTNQLVLGFLARRVFETVKKNILLDNDVIADIIARLGGPVVLLAEMKYTRDNESEADMLAFYEMIRAGWHPNGLTKFFGRLERLERGRTAIDVMLSDHPASADRATAIRNEMASVRMPASLRERTGELAAVKATLRSLPPAPKPVAR